MLYDPYLITRCIVFYSTVAEFMITLLQGSPYVPKADILFPAEIPDILAAVPEWFVEDIADFLLFILQLVILFGVLLCVVINLIDKEKNILDMLPKQLTSSSSIHC